jgi:hypothetical protein
MRASQLSAMQAGRYSHDLPFGSLDAPFLELIVDRENLLPDTLDAVARRPPADLKKPLRVKFTSDGMAEVGLALHYRVSRLVTWTIHAACHQLNRVLTAK